MNNLKYMRLGNHTYGWYDPETSNFTSSDGGWNGRLTMHEDGSCSIDMVSIPYGSYEFLPFIPEDYVQC